jgi:hypothetical protein
VVISLPAARMQDTASVIDFAGNRHVDALAWM